MIKYTITICLIAFYTSLYSQSVEGSWGGEIDLQGTKLTLVFNIENQSGRYNATMDSPDQGATGIPVDSVSFDGKNLSLLMTRMKISYVGVLKENQEIDGVFAQAGYEFPLILTKQALQVKKKNRPQTPQSPFNYYTEEVTFKNAADSVELSGTLSLPSQKGKFPVVVLITGSGPQDRDETIFEHKPFLVIADYLTNKGIGVLRYDDRGTGKSTGSFKSATSEDFAEDGTAAVEFLKSRKEINKKKIGLLGHSEGGMIAPMVAAGNKDIAFIVLLAGPGIRIDSLMILQSEKAARLGGADEETIKMNSKLYAGIYSIIKTQDESVLKDSLRAYLTKEFAKLPSDMKPPGQEEVESLIEAQVNSVTNPWFVYFVKYDPDVNLSKVKCPVLAMNGSLDFQVTPKENLSGIEKSLKRGGNKHYKITEMNGLNHLFQEAGTGAFEEYDQIEQTISPEALKEIENWINGKI